MVDVLKIGGVELQSRLFLGSGKFSANTLMPETIAASGSQVVTVALRRVNPQQQKENILNYIPKETILLPNTSGARSAEEAVRIARMGKAMGCGNWVKIEIISDNIYLMPDNFETIKATEILAKEGFVVLPYMSPDLMSAKRLVDAGAGAVMPLGSPIGSNKGLQTKELIKIMIEEIDLPIIVDAGIGRPSEATDAMELGAAAVLVNTAIATANNPVKMAEAFKNGVISGRQAFLAGLGPVADTAKASSPLTGFLHN